MIAILFCFLLLAALSVFFKLTRKSFSPIYLFTVLLFIGFTTSMCNNSNSSNDETTTELSADSTAHSHDHEHEDGKCCGGKSDNC